MITTTPDVELADLLLQTTTDGVMDWDIPSGAVTYSSRWKAILGYEEGLKETPELWRSLSHPEDLPEVDRRLSDHLDEFWPFNHQWRMLHTNGEWRWLLCRASTLRDSVGQPLRLVAIFSDITGLIETEHRMSALISAIPDLLLRVHASGSILDLKPPVGDPPPGITWPSSGQSLADWAPAESWHQRVVDSISEPENGAREVVAFESALVVAGGDNRQAEINVVPAGPREAVCLIRDVTDARQMQAELMQSHKLESIGQLAAGIAHEINTPTQYIGDSIQFVKDALTDCLELLTAYDDAITGAGDSPIPPETLESLATLRDDCDVEFLQTNLPKALESALEGTRRVASIVGAMKEFSHPRKVEKTTCDLHHEIETTITVSRNVWKYVADIEQDFDPNSTSVKCHAGELNQVILNLIVNASHAIGDAIQAGRYEKGLIRIVTRFSDPWVEIRIQDNANGVPENVQHRIFDPFFTTKGVGKGTGQGLAMARTTIADKHGGQLTFETEIGEGTTFIIRIPIAGAPPKITS